jgi:putative methylase
MSQGSLARELSRLERFETPNLALEQYATPGEIAAQLLWTGAMRGDIEGRRIVDLGAGTGVLGIGALTLGARVTFVELDEHAIDILTRNLAPFDRASYEIIHSDVTAVSGSWDTVVMNPPFGAQTRHADRLFLEVAFTLAPIVYSIHNANSTRFLESFCANHERTIEMLARAQLALPAAFEHHTKPRGAVEIVLVRIR